LKDAIIGKKNETNVYIQKEPTVKRNNLPPLKIQYLSFHRFSFDTFYSGPESSELESVSELFHGHMYVK
jgi:hypothetical protein